MYIRTNSMSVNNLLWDITQQFWSWWDSTRELSDLSLLRDLTSKHCQYFTEPYRRNEPSLRANQLTFSLLDPSQRRVLRPSCRTKPFAAKGSVAFKCGLYKPQENWLFRYNGTTQHSYYVSYTFSHQISCRFIHYCVIYMHLTLIDIASVWRANKYSLYKIYIYLFLFFANLFS